MWFIHVHTWTKDYEPIDIFLSGSGGTGKFYLLKMIYNEYQKH